MDCKDNIIIMECPICGNHTLLFSKQLQLAKDSGKYITCAYNGKHKKPRVVGKYENINECMKHDSYTRVRGRVTQKGWG